MYGFRLKSGSKNKNKKLALETSQEKEATQQTNTTTQTSSSEKTKFTFIDSTTKSINITGELTKTSYYNSIYNSDNNVVLSVNIGTNVTSIGDLAFAGVKLAQLFISSSVTSIGDYAFQKTDISFVRFEGDSGITKLNKTMFDGCKYLQTIYASSKTLKQWNINPGLNNTYFVGVPNFFGGVKFVISDSDSQQTNTAVSNSTTTPSTLGSTNTSTPSSSGSTNTSTPSSSSSTTSTNSNASLVLSPTFTLVPKTYKGAITLSEQTGEIDYLAVQCLQSLLIEWIEDFSNPPFSNTKETLPALIYEIRNAYFLFINGITYEEATNPNNAYNPNVFSALKDVYCIWYSDFYITGTAPNRLINYSGRMLVQTYRYVSSPGGAHCGSDNGYYYPMLDWVTENLPFLMTFTEGDIESGAFYGSTTQGIEIIFAPSDYWLESPGAKLKEAENVLGIVNPAYLSPNTWPFSSAPWFIPSNIVCQPILRPNSSNNTLSYTDAGLPISTPNSQVPPLPPPVPTSQESSSTSTIFTFSDNTTQSIDIQGELTSDSYSSQISNINNIVSVNIGTNVTSIAANAFLNGSLEQVIIPNTVTTLGETVEQMEPSVFGPFANNSHLKEVIFQENSQLTFIGGTVFYKCTALTTISIPPTVTYIGQSAFQESALSSVYIPPSVTTIEKYAFFNCPNLTYVVFEGNSGVLSLNNQLFEYCIKLNTIYASSNTLENWKIEPGLNKTYIVNGPTEGVNFLISDPTHTAPDYLSVWWNPMNTNWTSPITLKLTPSLDMIDVSPNALNQLANAWNIWMYNQNISNLKNNPYYILPTFGEVLGIYSYNNTQWGYGISNWTPVFNCLVWFSTITPPQQSTSTESGTTQFQTTAAENKLPVTTVNYWCSMFKFWTGYGPKFYRVSQTPGWPGIPELASQNNMWLYGGNETITGWPSTSTNPDFAASTKYTQTPVTALDFNNIYLSSGSNQVTSVNNLRLKQMDAIANSYITKIDILWKNMVSVDNSYFNTTNPPSPQAKANLTKQWATNVTEFNVTYDILRMIRCRAILLDVIQNSISFGFIHGQTYYLTLHAAPSTSSTTPSSIMNGGLVTMTETQNTTAGNTYVVVYNGTWSVNTYSTGDSYNIDLIAYLTINMQIVGDTTGDSAITTYLVGYNSGGVCDFYDASDFGLLDTEPNLTPSSSSSSSSSSSNKTFSLQNNKPLTRGFWDDVAGDITTAWNDSVKAIDESLDAIHDTVEELENDAKDAAVYIYDTSKTQAENLVKYVESDYWNMVYLGAGYAAMLLFPELWGTQLLLTLGVQGLGMLIGGPLGNKLYKDAQLFGAGNALGTADLLFWEAVVDKQGGVDLTIDLDKNTDYNAWSTARAKWEKAGSPEDPANKNPIFPLAFRSRSPDGNELLVQFNNGTRATIKGLNKDLNPEAVSKLPINTSLGTDVTAPVTIQGPTSVFWNAARFGGKESTPGFGK